MCCLSQISPPKSTPALPFTASSKSFSTEQRSSLTQLLTTKITLNFAVLWGQVSPCFGAVPLSQIVLEYSLTFRSTLLLQKKTTSDHVQPMSHRDFISFPSNSTIFVSKTSGHKQAGLVGQTSKGGHPVGISPHPESCQTVPVWMGLKKFPKISGAQRAVFVL